MEKGEGAVVQDVEEGEISDSASVEEISKEDYMKHGTAAKVSLKESNRESRVWTMRDLCKNYPTICRGYTSGLYNLAWAQAVQNKPLNDIFVLEVDTEKNAKRPTSPSGNRKEDAKSVKEVDEVVIDDIGDEIDVKILNAEKEEEELEEGEIDLDSEPVEIEGKASRFINDENINVDKSEVNSKQKELENQLKLIQEALEKINMNDAENSFEDVCSLLWGTLERLLDFSSVNNLLRKDVLFQQSFATIQHVCSAFHSMSHRQKEENKHLLSRLLVCMKKDKLSFFSPAQMKEIEEVILCGSVDSLGSLKTFGDHDKEIDNERIEASKLDFNISQANKFQSSITSSKLPPDYVDVRSVVHNGRNLSSGVSTFKSRGVLLPLLDLHKEHDADSLPSPTQETSIRFPVHKALVVEETHGAVKSQSSPSKAVLDSGYSRTRPYETDAIKAFSSYQQKFGQSSFFMNDRLPSPTPSEEHAHGGDDISEEYSSSNIVKNSTISNPSIFNQSVVNPGSCATAAFSPNIDSCGSQAMRTMTNAALVSCMSNSAMKRSAKSRDPRLRYLNDPGSDLNISSLPVIHSTSKVEPAGVICSGKQKIYDEPKLDGHAFKRQKIDEIHSLVKDGKPNCGIGGWLEDTESDGHELIKNQLVENSETELTNKVKVVNSSYSVNPNAKDSVNDQVLNASTGISTSLPALLKDIAVNPAMLINLLQRGQQQQLAAESLQKYSEPEICVNSPNSNSNSILGAAPLVSGASSLTLGILQKPDPVILPVHSQSTSMDEVGKIRMKPRDPRRILHTNMLQRSGSSGNEQFKMSVPIASSTQGSKDNSNGQNQEDQGDNVVFLPDIARQFTKNLKNIADIISVSKTPFISQNLQLQSVSVNLDKKDMKADDDSDSEGRLAGINSAPAVRQTGTSHSQSTWEDVEHLFEGFDDHQKAAIQRERVRRMGEQKKMFAGRKLSLVLDLDHTLLNSAKFLEVDPVHDEILRKKEEQDREKQQRQLFRLPHMGMWTKLRPGIWNFLEKASKLYELHLYTMGNKLYATEMAKVLDPTKSLFAGRVISRGDDGDLLDGDDRVPKTKDLEGVLGMESSVVIVDDSVRVWPHNKLNLIVVERYTYFPCSRRQFGLFGPSLLEIDHDERPEDGTLASSLAVIERIHQNFFSHQSLDEADVRNILAMEQRKILANCCILFSRVFPVGEANPHLHGLWKTAEQFGAVCTNHIDEQVTHVVANSLGTNKVNWALSTGRFVVHPGWVEASALLYRRANEQDFTIKH